MKVEVNYTKNVTCCKECPYYYQEIDMGAIIPICTKGKIILSSPNIIPKDCPIDAIKVKSFDTSSIGKEIKCNCEMDRVFTQKIEGNPICAKEIEDAFKTMGIVVRAKIERLCNEGKYDEAETLEMALIKINNADYNH